MCHSCLRSCIFAFRCKQYQIGLMKHTCSYDHEAVAISDIDKLAIPYISFNLIHVAKNPLITWRRLHQMSQMMIIWDHLEKPKWQRIKFPAPKIFIQRKRPFNLAPLLKLKKISQQHLKLSSDLLRSYQKTSIWTFLIKF